MPKMRLRQHQTAPDCLWKQAGVVKQKKCQMDFECLECRFDRKLRQASQENLEKKQAGLTPQGRKGRLVFWKDKLRMQPLMSKKPCIHHMKGHIGFKACHKSYHCIDCEFDQYFYDQFKVYTMIQPVGYKKIKGINIPDGYYLHPGHTWLKVEDKNYVRIGLDDYAARILGPPDHVESLRMGRTAEVGAPVFDIYRERNKAAFPSPVSGIVTEVNPALSGKPELLNQAPYTDGWVMTLYCKDLRSDLKALMIMEDTASFMEAEVEKLYRFLEHETQLMAADGGELGSDLYGNLPDLAWNRLLSELIQKTP